MVNVNAHFSLYPLLSQFFIAWLSIVLIATCVLLVAVITGKIQFLLDYEDESEASKWKQSCESNLYNCCCCTEDKTQDGLYPPPACPEWTNNDILILCQAFLTLIALLASLCLAFVVWGIAVATVILRNLKGYKVS